MKRRSETVARAESTRKSSVALPVPPAPSLRDGFVSAKSWKNAGRATPAAAFETALWASAGGDVETLAGLLLFDAEARTKAEALFTRLPSALRQELGNPERLIALLVAKDVPLGSAQIMAEIPTEHGSQMRTLLMDEQGKLKPAQLSLRLEGTGWRFVVPPRAVEKYASQLQAPVEMR